MTSTKGRIPIDKFHRIESTILEWKYGRKVVYQEKKMK